MAPLTDAAPLAAHRTAIRDARKGREATEDWIAQVRRALHDADPTGRDPQYEGHRQRVGAVDTALMHVRQEEQQLLNALHWLEQDMASLVATPPA